MNDLTKLGNRRVHHWMPPDPSSALTDTWKINTNTLTDTIAAAIPNLVCEGSSVAQIRDGNRVGISRAELQALIGQHVAYAKPVQTKDGRWQFEYHPYEFAPKPRFIPTSENPHPDPRLELMPDYAVLDQIFRFELARRLPRVY